VHPSVHPSARWVGTQSSRALIHQSSSITIIRISRRDFIPLNRRWVGTLRDSKERSNRAREDSYLRAVGTRDRRCTTKKGYHNTIPSSAQKQLRRQPRCCSPNLSACPGLPGSAGRHPRSLRRHRTSFLWLPTAAPPFSAVGDLGIPSSCRLQMAMAVRFVAEGRGSRHDAGLPRSPDRRGGSSAIQLPTQKLHATTCQLSAASRVSGQLPCCRPFKLPAPSPAVPSKFEKQPRPRPAPSASRTDGPREHRSAPAWLLGDRYRANFEPRSDHSVPTGLGQTLRKNGALPSTVTSAGNMNTLSRRKRPVSSVT